MEGESIILLSGGQDSTTCLALAKSEGWKVHALFFDYNQRHLEMELEASRKVSELAGVESFNIFKFPSLGGGLVKKGVDLWEEKKGLPTSFVPGRNLLFLTAAAGWGWERDIFTVWIGANEIDFSGYPDCRSGCLRGAQKALRACLDAPIEVKAPLLDLSKVEIIQLMEKLGKLDWYEWTHTCYEGRRPPCGTCRSCKIRQEAFEKAGIPDPLLR